jgi:CBS domain containing-hemolysin-like protein
MLEEELGVTLEDAHEATIGGHVVELIGRLPAVGEQIVVGGHRLEVCEVDDARIVKLRLEPVATQS